MLVPINVDDQRTITLAQSFGCEVVSFPFTYLGLPLGVSKPKVIDCLPLVKKCELRLSATSAFFFSSWQIRSYQLYFHCLTNVFHEYIYATQNIASGEALTSTQRLHQRQHGT